MDTWETIKTGYGLERIPTSLRQELACQDCARDARQLPLYTDQSIQYDGTLSGYQKLRERLRPRCWCRRHAEIYFG